MNDHFFIVGAQRSGTTYLYNMLAQHPDIEMATPVRPEPKFFLIDDLYSKGIEFYKNKFFSPKNNVLIRGEKTTSYMESDKAAFRIYKAFPHSKIIFMLRNPIHRAISNYNFSVENGFESESIENAFYLEQKRLENTQFDNKKVSVSPYAYLKRGLYMDNISMYLQYFPSKQIKIFIYEDFVNNLEKIKELYKFLGVDATFIPSQTTKVINASSQEESIQVLPKKLIGYLSDFYDKPNTDLEKKLGLNLSSWK